MTSKFYKIYLSLIIACGLTTSAQANNLSITNVGLASRDPGTKTLVVQFDVAWNNSWRNKINHDAIWLTVRLNNTADVITNKRLCKISTSGLNPTGSSLGTANNLEFYVPSSDQKGALLRRSSNGNVVDVSTKGAQLTIDYSSCGFSDTDSVSVSVFGLEMVLIPQGSFYAGDGVSTAALNNSSGGPLYINSENAIPISYPSNGNPSESKSGDNVTIPVTFPKGYNAFYAMKYKITQDQWVEFVNSLGSAAARAHRDITDNNHKNSDSVVLRNTVSCVGSTLSCSTSPIESPTALRPSRPVSFLSWMDLAAFLDWDALRPMTELEYEKMARGPLMPVPGEYAWGTADIVAATTISGNEDGTETISDLNANANFNNTTLTGGDNSPGGLSVNQSGPIRSGIFAATATSRITAGASYYGVMDLSGNLKERVVTIGNTAGLSFDAKHGDGILTGFSTDGKPLATITGFEGNANIANWPGLDSTPGHGVIGASGSGFRGGSWSDTSSLLRVSDRAEAALTSTAATGSFGGRGVRSYDGN